MPYWEGISECKLFLKIIFLGNLYFEIILASKDLINHLLVVDKNKRWKAIDVLCHPWIVSQGNSKPLPAYFEKFKDDYQNELAEKARNYASEPIISK